MKSADSPDYRPAVISVGVLSLAVILYGVFCLINFKVVEKHCTSISSGTVVENKSVSGRVGSFYKWTVAFTAADGGEYTFKTGKTRIKAGRGDQCAVKYDPGKPGRAFAPKAPPDNGVIWICTGVAVMVISYVMMFFKKSGGSS